MTLALHWLNFAAAVLPFNPIGLRLQRGQFGRNLLSGYGSNFHGHAQLAVMLLTVKMRDIGEIAFEALLANLAIKHLFCFIFLILLDPAHVLVYVELFLSRNQQTFGVAHLDCFDLCFWRLVLFAFLQVELLAAPVVHLSYHAVLNFLFLTHLLYITSYLLAVRSTANPC